MARLNRWLGLPSIPSPKKYACPYCGKYLRAVPASLYEGDWYQCHNEACPEQGIYSVNVNGTLVEPAED